MYIIINPIYLGDFKEKNRLYIDMSTEKVGHISQVEIALNPHRWG